tara:strand:- start:76 stop:345 length:270 start_codon:yes stop_codon:yes gene_type:complete
LKAKTKALNAGRSNNSTYTGVYWMSNEWKVRLRIDGVRETLGNFGTEKECARAYDNCVIHHELGRPCNFVDAKEHYAVVSCNIFYRSHD